MSKIIFDEFGHGPAVVFLHGFCERKEIWRSFVKNMIPDFRIITIDLPAFASSDKNNPHFTIDDVADAVAGCLIENNVTNALIVGHSLGGYVTLSILERHPQIVKGFCLFHSTAFADGMEKKQNRNKSVEFLRKNETKIYIDSFIPNLFFDPSHPSLKQVLSLAYGISVETLIGYMQAMRDRPDRGHLLKSQCPKLIIAGLHDPFVSIEDSRKMEKMAINSTYLELEKAAHIGFLENELECRQSIVAFANRIFKNE